MKILSESPISVSYELDDDKQLRIEMPLDFISEIFFLDVVKKYVVKVKDNLKYIINVGVESNYNYLIIELKDSCDYKELTSLFLETLLNSKFCDLDYRYKEHILYEQKNLLSKLNTDTSTYTKYIDYKEK